MGVSAHLFYVDFDQDDIPSPSLYMRPTLELISPIFKKQSTSLGLLLLFFIEIERYRILLFFIE